MSLAVIGQRTDDERRLHPYCQECKFAAKARGKDWKAVTGNCHGVYSDEDFKCVSQATQSGDTPCTEEEAREILDPSYWIWKYLGLTPYWYQDRYLRCTSSRKALRWGRRTGKSHILAAEQVYRCITSAGLKITIATPVKAQALEIVTRINDFLREAPLVGLELDRAVQQPYYSFEFKNGSRIRLFVTGLAAGANAGATVRGQEADVLIIDELDYVDDSAAAAILPLLSDPQRTGEMIKFAVSSTPTGKEGLFYRLCNDDEYFELHIPSRFRADWDSLKEQEARKLSKTNDNYLHEYEAEWGSKSDGVYTRSRVIRAMQPYRYFNMPAFYDNEQDWPEMKPWAHWTYMIGVDWNGPGTGSRIAVVGFDPERGKWIVVYREAITVEEFALHIAVERVVKLVRFWQPHSVYIDAGFGQMQDEYLRGIGRVALNCKMTGQPYEAADLVLLDHLKAIDFGSSIEYTVTNENGGPEKIKKNTKNYMVENLQRHFELDSIWFSKSDVDLKLQFMGYNVARQGKHNENIYKADKEVGDHDHDAVLLAFYAFNNEFDLLSHKNRSAQYVSVQPRPFQLPADKGMPDPMEDPRGYELWLAERKGRGGKPVAMETPTDVPSRVIRPPAQNSQLGHSGIALLPVKTNATKGMRYRPPAQGRNAWRKKGNQNGRSV
jgi:hypothetical protein